MRAAVAQLRGDAEQTAAFAHRALAELDERRMDAGVRHLLDLTAAEWLRGRPAEAERAFLPQRLQHRRLAANGELTLAAWGYYHLGRVQRAQGHLSAALATYQEALEAVAGEPGQPPCRPPAWPMWAWPRWPTNATSWTLRSSTPPRASPCPGSSAGPRRWSPA